MNHSSRATAIIDEIFDSERLFIKDVHSALCALFALDLAHSEALSGNLINFLGPKTKRFLDDFFLDIL